MAMNKLWISTLIAGSLAGASFAAMPPATTPPTTHPTMPDSAKLADLKAKFEADHAAMKARFDSLAASHKGDIDLRIKAHKAASDSNHTGKDLADKMKALHPRPANDTGKVDFKKNLDALKAEFKAHKAEFTKTHPDSGKGRPALDSAQIAEMKAKFAEWLKNHPKPAPDTSKTK